MIVVSNNAKAGLKYCYTSNEDGFRVFCAVGGDRYCIYPENPKRCRYHILDEQIIYSEDGRMSVHMVYKVNPPEVQIWLLDNAGKIVGGPYATPSLAKQAAHEYFKRRLDVLTKIPMDVEE